MRCSIVAGMALAANLGMTVEAFAEDITLTTYYPSPRGVYEQLRTTNNTYLATLAGRVGIGTTTPGTYDGVTGKLEVRGSPGEQPGIVVHADADRAASLMFVHAGDSEWAISSRGTLDAPNNRLGLYALDGGAGTELISILQTGNVGIGTTTPAADTKLQIVSDAPIIGTVGFGALNKDMWFDGGTDGVFAISNTGAAAGSTIFQRWDGATATQILLLANTGNVGIGMTTLPGDRLVVQAPTGPRVVANVTDETSFAEFVTQSNGTNKWSFGSTADAFLPPLNNNTFYIWQYTNAADASINQARLVINDAGNVGIGTTTAPTQKLDVDGSLRVRQAPCNVPDGMQPGMVLRDQDGFGTTCWGWPTYAPP